MYTYVYINSTDLYLVVFFTYIQSDLLSTKKRDIYLLTKKLTFINLFF